jgi:drug/metabolite transporter (DMT)-like permease
VCILFAFAKVTRQNVKFTPGTIAGACIVACSTTLYTAATKLTTAANAILLQFTSPIWVILFMWLIFKEKPKKLDILTSVIVFCGIGCFFLDGLGSGDMVGDCLAVLAGICYGWIFMLNKIPGGDPLSSNLLGHGLAAIVGLPSLLQETQFDSRTLTAAVVMGVFQLGIAYIFLTVGVKYAPPVSASLVTGIEPILSPILVALAIGEVLTPLSLLGGAIVFVTVMVYNVLGARAEAKEAAQAAE